MMSRGMRCVFLWLSTFAWVGCSGPTGFSAFKVKESVFGRASYSGQPIDYLVLADHAGICAALKANQKVRNSSVVIAILADSNGNATTNEPSVGSYSVASDLLSMISAHGKRVMGAWTRFDGNCADSEKQMQTGTVDISQINIDPVSGTMAASYQLTLSNAADDKGSNSFTAAFCDANYGAYDVKAATCQQ